MIIDDSIVHKYLSGKHPETYKNCWIYSALGGGYLFEDPDPKNREWVSKLCTKLRNQISDFLPRNEHMVKNLFPEIDDVIRDYTAMLVVGFPDPYDAMALEYNGKGYTIFDLIQFGADSLDETYSCHRVLTHELIHLCLDRKYPNPIGLSYVDKLNYTAFHEGFAHALSFPEDIATFKFDNSLADKYRRSKKQLQIALRETNADKQKQYLAYADKGDYWDKYASISGKLFLLNNLKSIEDILLSGWNNFTERILNDKC